MRKKNRPTDGGGSWMDTYGDMVTLLLTFFIMLFSMSNVDAKKWDVFIKSISARDNGVPVEEVLINSEVGEMEPPADGETLGSPEDSEPLDPTDTSTLYLTIAEALNAVGVTDATVMRGEDYTYIGFENSTFFDGGSSILEISGRKVLDAFCESISHAADGISQISIMSHTAKADPNGETDVRTDRILSAMRAAEVAIYIQNKNVIEPRKLVNVSYGEYRPIADNSTPEGRAKNRRIEVIILDKDAKARGLDEYYKDLQGGSYKDTTIVTVGTPS